MNPTSLDEIDLRPFLFSLLRRWRWVFGAAILGAGVVAAIILVQPRNYEATALLLFEGERTQLALDERIVAADSVLSDRFSRRSAWIALAQSDAMIRLLPPEVVEEVLPDNITQEELSDYISVTTEGDLIELSAIGTTPEKAQLLANTWGRVYVTHVNTLTTGDGTALIATEQQLADAQARYETAQGAFEMFVGTAQMGELDNRIANLSALLEANLASKQTQYAEQISMVNGLQFFLQHVQSLRSEVEGGSTTGLGEDLAALSLRLQSIGGTAGLQLQIDDLTSVDTTPEEVVATLDRLAASVREEINSRNTRIAELNEAMEANTPAPGSNLTAEQFNGYYAQLRDWSRQREELEGQYLTLLQERTVTLEALEVLQRRRAEQAAAGTPTDIEVLFAGEASLPIKPANRGLVRSTIIGGIMGAMLGVVAALATGLRSTLDTTRRQRTADRPADSPSYS